MTEIKVLLVAENPLARMGLAALLAGVSGLTVAGQSSGNQVALDLELAKPDVIAWDWSWNSVPELPREMPIVALLKESSQAAEAWRAGARGLLVGHLDPDSLGAALTAASHGFAIIEPTLISALAQIESAQPEGQVEALTPREMEVLQLLAVGLPNKTIASRLSITDHTVKFHVNAIMTKLGVQSRTEAVVRATKLGLIIL
ncbi:MAG: DNA-binding response regulator [Anaerolineaceae bacterium]|nr:DNA-binding response regulator [Anaerolineaceae bacterium]